MTASGGGARLGLLLAVGAVVAAVAAAAGAHPGRVDAAPTAGRTGSVTGRSVPRGVPSRTRSTPSTSTSTTVDPDAAASPPSASGVIDRVSVVTGLPSGIRGWTIRYGSTDATGAAISVTGRILRPDRKAPAGGFPVVDWAHQTVGIADSCAPSASPGDQLDAAVVAAVRAGYAVVATDYEGLGDPSRPHPYLDGPSEARSVLDAARAIRGFSAAAATGPMVVWGYSQGGQAALFASQLASTYAPELSFRGFVVVSAPVTLGWLDASLRDVERLPLAVEVIASWSEVDHILDPRALLTAAGRSVLDAVRGTGSTTCPDTTRLLVAAAQAAGASRTGSARTTTTTTLPTGDGAVVGLRSTTALVTGTFTGSTAWSARARRVFVPASGAPVAPVLVVSGQGDVIVPPSEGTRTRDLLCRAGGVVTTETVPGGHLAGLAPDAPLAWIGGVVAGRPVTNSCPGH